MTDSPVITACPTTPLAREGQLTTRMAVILAVAGGIVAKAAFLILLAIESPQPVLDRLMRADAGWFARVVNEGYFWPSRTGHSNLAFFPLFPMLAKGLTYLGLSTDVALVAVSWASTLAAAVLLALLGAQVRSPRVGLWLALLWLIAPRSHVQVMGYSESLFTALAAASLLLLVQRKWLLAGLLCSLAGLTRSTGLVLIATLGLATIWCTVQASPVDRVRTFVRGALATALGSVGFFSFWAYTAWWIRDVRGYLKIQDEWGSVTVAPWMLPVDAVRHLDGPWSYSSVAAAVLLSLALVVWLLGSREDWVLVAYACLGFLMICFQGNYFRSKARLLLPFFPLWLPPARAVARIPVWAQAAVFLALAGATAWWGVTVSMGTVPP